MGYFNYQPQLVCFHAGVLNLTIKQYHPIIPGHNLVSRIGFGASGPFGDNAVDWRRGQCLEPLEATDLFVP